MNILFTLLLMFQAPLPIPVDAKPPVPQLTNFVTPGCLKEITPAAEVFVHGPFSKDVSFVIPTYIPTSTVRMRLILDGKELQTMPINPKIKPRVTILNHSGYPTRELPFGYYSVCYIMEDKGGVQTKYPPYVFRIG